jgi:hypothetical protein
MQVVQVCCRDLNPARQHSDWELDHARGRPVTPGQVLRRHRHHCVHVDQSARHCMLTAVILLRRGAPCERRLENHLGGV